MRTISSRLHKVVEHWFTDITMQLEKLRVAANKISRLEGEVKILKEKYDYSLASRERDSKINKEWHYKMGKENKNLSADLEAYR